MRYPTLSIAVLFAATLNVAIAQPPGPIPPQGYVDLHTHLTSKHYYSKTTYPSECTQADSLPEHLRAVNWDSVGHGSKAWRKCKPSTYSNYFQANYSELRAVPGSILCNCIYPLEKQLTYNGFKRWVSANFVSKIPRSRLKVNSGDMVSPWIEFISEYDFALKGTLDDPTSALRILYPKDGQELREHLDDPNTINSIFTVEGGQVFYGLYAGQKDRVRGWLCDHECAAELLHNVDALRELPHRVFFIALAHFTDNHIVGNAKTLDRKGFTRTLTHGLGGIPVGNKYLFNKWGDGIHGELDVGTYAEVGNTGVSLPYTETPVTDTIGRAVIERLLRPIPGSLHPEPVYVDVKHMDLQARLDYYLLRNELAARWNIQIPVIASHIAVSGEDTCVAKATGGAPLYDRYPELNDPLSFYCEQERDFAFDWETRNAFLGLEPLNPFSDHVNPSTAGWFYPWSINLADEELSVIHNSEGIMGLMLDGRQLGQGMPQYTKVYWNAIEPRFHALIKEAGLDRSAFNWNDYMEMEPLMRNIVYIAEHCGDHGVCWDHLSIGSDMDGLIQPMSVCRTTRDIPELRKKLVAFLPIYADIHGHRQLFTHLSPTQTMDKVFYINGRDFILKWY